MNKTQEPGCCAICGYYLTIDEQISGPHCIDPGHWQAAGLLAPRDFYAMARMVARARAEIARRSRGEMHRSLQSSAKGYGKHTS